MHNPFGPLSVVQIRTFISYGQSHKTVLHYPYVDVPDYNGSVGDQTPYHHSPSNSSHGSVPESFVLFSVDNLTLYSTPEPKTCSVTRFLILLSSLYSSFQTEVRLDSSMIVSRYIKGDSIGSGFYSVLHSLLLQSIYLTLKCPCPLDCQEMYEQINDGVREVRKVIISNMSSDILSGGF